MSTTADFVGRDCPLCGAADALETDDVRGEVACTACAKVVVMGLEESVQTRFLKDATFEDADRHAADDPSASTVWSATGGTLGAQTRQDAAAAVHRRAGTSSAIAASAVEEQYRKVLLNPRLKSTIEALGELSRRQSDGIIVRAIALAKHFVGGRRARGEKVDRLPETAAACFLLAAEQLGTPVPTAELRCMDPTVNDVDTRRQEIIRETNRTQEFINLSAVYAINLIRYYIRLLHLQRSAYEPACVALHEALKSLMTTRTDIAQLVEAERVVAAVLLARTEPSLSWADKPPYLPDEQIPLLTVYDGFAEKARLPPARIRKVMQLVTGCLTQIRPIFEAAMHQHSLTQTGITHAGEPQQQIGTKRERPHEDMAQDNR
eukprot:gene1304-754_t